MNRLLSFIQTTGDRAAILWVIGTFSLVGYWSTTYSGPFLWLLDFETKTFGEHFPFITFLGLVLPPLPLALLVRGVVNDVFDRVDSTKENPDMFEGLGPGLLVGGLVVGLGVAAVVALGGYLYLFSGLVEQAIHTPVAARDIKAGGLIARGDIAWIDGVELAGSALDLSQRVAAVPIRAGDPLYEARLLPAGKMAGKVALTPTGHRTLWIPVDSGVAGLGLKANDRVDLWVTSTASKANHRTSKLVEGVVVIEVKAGNPLAPARVTLAVPKDDAEAVTRAVEVELLTVTLRSARDFPLAPEPPVEPFVPEAESTHGEVLRAAATIQAGTALTADVLVPAFGDPKDAPDLAALQGKVLAHGLLPGERVTTDALAYPERGVGLAAVITAGSHAISVPPEKKKTLDDYPLGEEARLLGGKYPVIGHQPEGDGCPCVVVEVGPDAASDAVRARAIASKDERKKGK